MKKLFFTIVFLLCAFTQGAWAEIHEVDTNNSNAGNNSGLKCLVIYYSYSGVTESLAEEIAANCNGTLLQVVDHGNYPRPESQTTYTYANNERNQIDAGNWPVIQTTVENFDEWDAIIVCTPLWNGKMANPMLTFLHNHADKLVRKQVALAVTSYSSGITKVLADAHNNLPEAIFVGNPLHIDHNHRNQIAAMASEWVNSLEFVASSPNKMRVIVGDKTFEATIEDNSTGDDFIELLPMTINMIELNGNEKYYYLDLNLTTDAINPGTINSGDIMLYRQNCLVLFYQTFQTTYSYTRIGKIDDPTGLADAVGLGAVTVTFQLVPNNLIIADKTDNSEAITNVDGYKMDQVTLEGRTLFKKDKTWNTICLPFAMKKISGTPLEGATIKTLTSSDFSDGTLTLNFNDATEIEAGKPYLIKWEGGGDNITDPVFKNVTIENTNKDILTDYVNFVGSYSPVTLTSDNRSVLYLGAANTLYYPSAEVTIGSCRAYFDLKGLTVSESTQGGSGIKAFKLNFGDEESGINSITEDSKRKVTNDVWYTLDGLQVSGRPTARGFYLSNGKKILNK